MTNDKINNNYNNLTNLLLNLISVIRKKNSELKELISKVNTLISSISLRKNREEFNSLNNYRKLLNKQVFNGKDNSLYVICNYILIELENLTNSNLGGLTYEEVRKKVLDSSKRCVEKDVYDHLMQKINYWDKTLQNIQIDGHKEIIKYYEERMTYCNLMDKLNKTEKSFVQKMNGVKDEKIVNKYEGILNIINHLKKTGDIKILGKNDDVIAKTRELELYNNRAREIITEIEKKIKICVNSYLSLQRNIKKMELRREKAFSQFRDLENKINELVSIQDEFPKQERGEIQTLFHRFCIESVEIYNLYSLLFNLHNINDNVKVTMLEAKCSILLRRYIPQIETLYQLHNELYFKENNKLSDQENNFKMKALNLLKTYMNQGVISLDEENVLYRVKKPKTEVRRHLNHLYTTIFNMSYDSFNLEDFQKCQNFLLDIVNGKYYLNDNQSIIEMIENYKLELIERKRTHM